ncbi:MAG: glycoside hydrolase family 27 protein [Gemmatimonadaceae bacterium]|nr:glycoside hydrolase family 27 protein [Chitinophagaceae bacterium]
MKYLCQALLIFALLTAYNAIAQPAAKPPMGWNSYNCFGSAVYESEVKENADYISKNLKNFGWEYVVVDFLWAFDNPPGSLIGNPFQKRMQDGSYIPWMTMDKWGRLIPHTHKFPSAFGGKGFKPLSDYVHGLGLKFGIHVMRGIPRQAVWAKSPVMGAPGITADMIADTNSICPWLNHMYGLDMSKPGAQEYLNSILALYKEWDVDFIKVDDIARPYRTAEVEGYQKAIKTSGREMVLSLSPGETALNASAHAQKFSNMWRMADDFWDNWDMLLKMFDYAQSWKGTGGPGHWPDCDMIQIGKLSKRGPVGPERYSRFTEDELFTHMNFWCIYRSPLMLGGNLPENRELELKLFSNEEVLAVNQQGANPRQIFKDSSTMIWMSDAGKEKDFYVSVFNIGNTAEIISLEFRSLGINGKVTVRDLWQKKDIGSFSKKYSTRLNAHGSVMLRVTQR